MIFTQMCICTKANVIVCEGKIIVEVLEESMEISELVRSRALCTWPIGLSHAEAAGGDSNSLKLVNFPWVLADSKSMDPRIAMLSVTYMPAHILVIRG